MMSADAADEDRAAAAAAAKRNEGQPSRPRACQECQGPIANQSLLRKRQPLADKPVEQLEAVGATNDGGASPQHESSSSTTAPTTLKASRIVSRLRPDSPARSKSDFTGRTASSGSDYWRDSVVGQLPLTGSVVPRRASTVTVYPDKDHKLRRSVSASINAVLAHPPQPVVVDAFVRPDLASGGSRPDTNSLSTFVAAATMTSAYSRRQLELAQLKKDNANVSADIISPLSVYAQIVDTTNKRIATLDYMRKVYEGDVYYLNSVSYATAQISTLPSLNAGRSARRATNYLFLGTSLSPLLALHAQNPLEYLRALTSLVTEFETYCGLSSDTTGSSLRSGRVGQMLKSGMRGVKSRRTSGAAESIMTSDSANGSSMNLAPTPVSPLDNLAPQSLTHPTVNTAGYEFHFLQIPNLPFDPDFTTSFATLIDVLTDAYQHLLVLLKAPDACSPPVVEAYAKADKALRKALINAMTTEMAESTRKEAKVEIGGLGKLVLAGLM